VRLICSELQGTDFPNLQPTWDYIWVGVPIELLDHTVPRLHLLPHWFTKLTVSPAFIDLSWAHLSWSANQAENPKTPRRFLMWRSCPGPAACMWPFV